MGRASASRGQTSPVQVNDDALLREAAGGEHDDRRPDLTLGEVERHVQADSCHVDGSSAEAGAEGIRFYLERVRATAGAGIPSAGEWRRTLPANGSPSRPATAYRRAVIFDEAAAIIRTDYGERLSLDAVARRVATSRRQLQRAFSDAGEESFRTYVQRVRMEKAAQLLAERPLAIRQIAAAVGYEHQEQFSKAFRRRYGISPSGYRRRQVGLPAAGADASIP